MTRILSFRAIQSCQLELVWESPSGSGYEPKNKGSIPVLYCLDFLNNLAALIIRKVVKRKVSSFLFNASN